MGPVANKKHEICSAKYVIDFAGSRTCICRCSGKLFTDSVPEPLYNHVDFTALMSEGCWFLALPLTCRNFSGFSEFLIVD